jgi:hypothetical protein
MKFPAGAQFFVINLILFCFIFIGLSAQNCKFSVFFGEITKQFPALALVLSLLDGYD